MFVSRSRDHLRLAVWTQNLRLLKALLPADDRSLWRAYAHLVADDSHKRCLARCIDWSLHTFVDFNIGLVIRKDLLVNELLKLLLVLQGLLLLRICLFEQSKVENVAVLALALIAWWRLYLLFFSDHILQTMKLLYSFLGIVFYCLRSFVLFLDFMARSSRQGWLVSNLVNQAHRQLRFCPLQGTWTMKKAIDWVLLSSTYWLNIELLR